MSRGIRSKESGKKIMYLTVSKGYFAQRVDEGTPKSTPRRLTKGENEGKIIHELLFNEFAGQLTDIRIDDKNAKYGKNWEFVFDCTTEDQELEIRLKTPYSSNYANNILFKLPNIDLSADLTLSSYCFPDKEKKDRMVAGISVKQNDKKVLNYYNRDTPNGLPDLKKVKVKGIDQWDDTDRLEFLEKMVKDVMGVLYKSSELQENVEFTKAAKEDGDDIPF